ncbi:hypothetical protein [Arsenophonus sp.]|uniref:hypothetical protein n=1 Tax=Arsenophonus sp. TaxID=1872640 RepID=UPI0038791566
MINELFLFSHNYRLSRTQVRLLKTIASLGEEGIAKASGLRKLSEQYNVNLTILKSYLNKKGPLTVRGKRFSGHESNMVTPEMLTKIASLGALGVAKAGGLTGISEQFNVNLSTLKTYLDKNGALTVRGCRRACKGLWTKRDQ